MPHGTHSALQRDLGEDVIAQVAQHSAGVGQLGAAQVDLVVRHHLHELKDLLPAGDEARAQRVVHAEGLGGRGGRCGRVVRGIRELLPQLHVVQDEPVAVVGNAQAVGGLAVGGGGKVGADPGGQPRARVRALGQQRPVQRAQRGVNPVELAAPIRREETVGQVDLVDGEPGVASAGTYLKVAVRAGHPLAAVHVDRCHAFSKEAARSTDDGLDGCDGGAAGDVFTPRVDERRASEQLLAQEAERRSHRRFSITKRSSKRLKNISFLDFR